MRYVMAVGSDPNSPFSGHSIASWRVVDVFGEIISVISLGHSLSTYGVHQKTHR